MNCKINYELTLFCRFSKEEKKSLRNFYDSINPEFGDTFKRSSVKIELDKKKFVVSFKITADDVSALTATSNSVLKLIKVYEGVKGLVKDE